MATFIKRKNGYLCQIRRKGHETICRTFDTKADAERWALQIESKMGVGTYVDNRETLNTTLAECFERYANEIVPLKKGAKREMYRIKAWLNDPLSKKAIGTIRQVDVASWRDAKIETGLSGTTVKLELQLLSHLFTIAIKEWGYPLTNPVSMIRKPKSNESRDRRLHPGEYEKLLDHCTVEMSAFITIAIETAMRRGEMVGLQRCWIRGRVAYLPTTKNGTPRAVPLSTIALQAINSLPIRIDGKLFSHPEDYYTHLFSDICAKAGIVDLRLHDLRHEGTSRFFEKGLDIMQVKAITGHKSIQMLSRYTHLKADDLAALLG